MAIYQIYQFNAAALPLYNPEQDLAPPDAPSVLVAAVGSVFDYAGSRRALAARHDLTVRGIFHSPETVYLVDHAANRIVDHAANRIIVATALGYLRYQVQALTGQIGQQGTLWRKRWDDESIRQWKTARLRGLRLPHDYTRRLYMAEVEASFESTMAAWRAATATTVTANLVSGGSVGIRLQGGGDVQIDDAVLTITASDTITNLTIVGQHAGISLSYTGTLSSGQMLTIDAGARTVRRDSTNHYQYFALASSHTADGWLPIAAGITPIIIASNGPGTVTVMHYDQFL